MASLGHPDHF
jgi:hypothetical protein